MTDPIKRIDRSIPWETQKEFDEVTTFLHTSRNGAMQYLIKQEVRKIRAIRLKEAEAAGALIIPASEEGWFTWLREEARQRGIPEADLLGKCMTSYLEGLMYRQIGREQK